MCSYCEGVVRDLTSVIWSASSLVLMVGVDICTSMVIYSFEVVIEG